MILLHRWCCPWCWIKLHSSFLGLELSMVLNPTHTHLFEPHWTQELYPPPCEPGILTPLKSLQLKKWAWHITWTAFNLRNTQLLFAQDGKTRCLLPNYLCWRRKGTENVCACAAAVLCLGSRELYSNAVTAAQLSTESWEDVLRALVAYARQQKLTAEYWAP